MYLDDEGGGGGFAQLFNRRRREGPYPAYVPPPVAPQQAMAPPQAQPGYPGAGLQGIVGDRTAQMGYQLQKGTREQNIAYALRRLALLQQIGLGGTPGEDEDPLEAYKSASAALTEAAHEMGFADPRQYLVWKLKQARSAQGRGYAGGR